MSLSSSSSAGPRRRGPRGDEPGAGRRALRRVALAALLIVPAAFSVPACGGRSSPAADAASDAASEDGGAERDGRAAGRDRQDGSEPDQPPDASGSDALSGDLRGDSPDGSDGPPPDGGTCTTAGGDWQLVETAITDLRLLDVLSDEAPATPARSFRVAAGYLLGCSQQPAIAEVSVAGTTAELRVRVWDNGIACAGPSVPIERFIPLRLAEAGSWQIRDAAAGGTASLTVQLEPDPGDPCTPTAEGEPCSSDCQCLAVLGGGGACLSGGGRGGPFTACAYPCEVDQDCDGACVDVADGLARTCDSSQPQCDEQRPCRAGYTCDSEHCRPDFQLGPESRVACDCDADCAAPLSCVVSQSEDQPSRCELRCPSQGNWCQGPHFCGEPFQDVSGLAQTGSVCVFAGE